MNKAHTCVVAHLAVTQDELRLGTFVPELIKIFGNELVVAVGLKNILRIHFQRFAVAIYYCIAMTAIFLINNCRLETSFCNLSKRTLVLSFEPSLITISVVLSFGNLFLRKLVQLYTTFSIQSCSLYAGITILRRYDMQNLIWYGCAKLINKACNRAMGFDYLVSVLVLQCINGFLKKVPRNRCYHYCERNDNQVASKAILPFRSGTY
jgi:hypothetical protein